MGKGGFSNSKVLATLAFGLGSFLILAELLVGVMIGEEGIIEHITHPVDWTLLGYIGLLLWVGATAFAIVKRAKKGSGARYRESVFLRGDTVFKCRSCGMRVDASSVGYHERIRCGCGEEYDVFQDMPWDETYSQKEEIQGSGKNSDMIQ